MSFTAYCTVAQVEAEGSPAGKVYTTTGKPTITQVEGFCSQIYREINSRLATVGVSTPVSITTSPISYALMTDLNALGAAAKALRIAFSRAEPNKSDWVDELKQDYLDKLQWYCDNLSALSDAATDSANTVLSRTADLMDVDDPDDITEHRFYRGQIW